MKPCPEPLYGLQIQSISKSWAVEVSVDIFSVGFVMLVSVGPESRQPGTWQDD